MLLSMNIFFEISRNNSFGSSFLRRLVTIIMEYIEQVRSFISNYYPESFLHFHVITIFFQKKSHMDMEYYFRLFSSHRETYQGITHYIFPVPFFLER